MSGASPPSLFQSNGAGAAVTPQLEYIIPQQAEHQEPLLKIPAFIPDYLFTYSAVRRMKLTQWIVLFRGSRNRLKEELGKEKQAKEMNRGIHRVKRLIFRHVGTDRIRENASREFSKVECV